MNVLIIINSINKNHAYRLIHGIKACNINPVVVTNIDDLDSTVYDYILLEASYDKDCSKLKNLYKEHLILFDSEDAPLFFDLKLAYETTKDFASAYAKYNYQLEKPNPTNLKLIGMPQVDYIYRGAQLAAHYEQLSKNKQIGDVLLIGFPTYFNQFYKPVDESKFTRNEEINVLVDDPDTNHVGCKAYHQRLDWIYQYSKSNLKCLTGLRFDDKTPGFSLEDQKKIFGKACERFVAPWIDHSNYYNLMASFPIGPSPAGVARSSYRIIELMALGRIILSTDMEGYTYLYNPKKVTTIPDAANIVEYTKEALEKQDELLVESRENVGVFLGLTPEKMFKDFINQI